jgi:hypothetical protein
MKQANPAASEHGFPAVPRGSRHKHSLCTRRPANQKIRKKCRHYDAVPRAPRASVVKASGPITSRPLAWAAVTDRLSVTLTVASHMDRGFALTVLNFSAGVSTLHVQTVS